jgi:hypothetical protein
MRRQGFFLPQDLLSSGFIHMFKQDILMFNVFFDSHGFFNGAIHAPSLPTAAPSWNAYVCPLNGQGAKAKAILRLNRVI